MAKLPGGEMTGYRRASPNMVKLEQDSDYSARPHTVIGRAYATGRLKDSGRKNDEKMPRETVNSRSCATFFPHSSVLSLPAVLLRKVSNVTANTLVTSRPLAISIVFK